MNMPHIFVYGTLRKGFDHPMSKILNSNAHWEGHGYIYAQLFDLGAYPGIVLDKELSNNTYGDLYDLTNPSIGKLLDEYEGDQYKKTITNVFVKEHVFQANVYELVIPTKHFTFIPSGDYLSYIA